MQAAIEYATGNIDAAKVTINDMPPRTEEELDSVILHPLLYSSKISNICKTFWIYAMQESENGE